MMAKPRRPTPAWSALVLAGFAWAADPVPAVPEARIDSSTAPLSRAVVGQKLRLARQQLGQSRSAKRILQSDNGQALALLAQAQALVAQAEVAAASDQWERAAQQVDQALRDLVLAASLVPDTALLAEQERRRALELREALRSFRQLQGDAADAELQGLDAMARNADQLMASGQQHAAYALLNQAHQQLVARLGNRLNAQTLVVGLHFASPAEEFHYEQARNLGLEELMPLALQQHPVAPETALLADRYVRQGRSLRQTAQEQFAGGDAAAAIAGLQQASALLQRALRLAGVALPLSPTSP